MLDFRFRLCQDDQALERPLDMWNPAAVFVSALHTVVGGLFLFFAAGALAYLLVAFEPRHELSVVDLILAWLPMVMMAILCFTGVPLLLVHFWTLYHLLFTENSRLKLFFIALTTHTAAFISVFWRVDFSDHWLRGLLCIIGLTVAYFGLKRLKSFPDSRLEPSNL